MIEEEEKMIFYLEELDNNFSKINRTLKEIEDKIENIYKKNLKLVDDYKPFIKLFSNNKKIRSPRTETTQELENLKVELNSSVIMNSSSPKDPFTNTSSDLLNKNILNKFNDETRCESSSTIEELKIYSDCYNDEDSSSDLVEFDINRIPVIFKNEEDFFKVYNFIVESKKTRFDEIVDNFSYVDYNKICIYLEVLRNKKFVKKKGNIFFIEF
jgi:hypothetical protein